MRHEDIETLAVLARGPDCKLWRFRAGISRYREEHIWASWNGVSILPGVEAAWAMRDAVDTAYSEERENV